MLWDATFMVRILRGETMRAIRVIVLYPLLALTSVGAAYFAWSSLRVFGGPVSDTGFPRPPPFPDGMIVSLNNAFHSDHSPSDGLEMHGHLYEVQFVLVVICISCGIAAWATAFVLWSSRRGRQEIDSSDDTVGASTPNR